MRRIALIYRGLPLLLVTLLVPAAALAQENETWTALDGDQIKEVFVGVVLDYPNAWQDFRASGKTLYNAGEDSWGNWRVESDQYCSQWPPRDLWDCYDVARRGDDIRFTDAQGNHSIGTIRQ
ncbi:hypothetical protein [Planktotalea sp.]|uniref:hypothetical protein n=1 Tax=Planktotalea sp. TaxID=2029877 RepID=UPI003297B157